MTATMAAFQDAFIDALYGRATGEGRVLAMMDQPGFAVYRNTILRGCVDALQANFPAVVRLVGEAWFRAAAVEYALLSPPAEECLLRYGKGFPDFLASFEPAKALPYLPSVAQLDSFWLEAHVAADEAHVTVSDLAAWPAPQLERAVLRLHPSARWRWFANEPAYTIWRANREGADMPEDLEWRGEGALLIRPSSEVTWHPLSAGGCAFLDACANGQEVESAATQACNREPEMDLGQCVAALLAAGVVAGIKQGGVVA